MPLTILSRLIDFALALGGLAIVALVFGNAFLRGAAGFDLAWSLEVTAFLLLWTTFLGCAAATARGVHMRVTEIADSLVPRAAAPWVSFVIDLIVIAILLSLIWQGWNISTHTWAQKSTVLYWPIGLLYASMPVGMALTLVFQLFHTWTGLRDRRIAGPAHSDGGDPQP
ncbi:TRAP transporter small permease [Sulfitobacter sp. D35]|uniref:TRAP transporter small permease n=1 Tax=Sulfitobacter sp. D35 TaxID=3083252 RepID=UPI00296FCD59|nr:TRAP transporter small permease [Sulfitobacter sp. D35]MDW4499171.1 TRAP transporter small permease [Sulfitobacter sp. D35]